MNAFIKKAAGVAITASMVAASFAPIAVPLAHAASSIHIDTLPPIGCQLLSTQISISGTATADAPPGQLQQYEVDIDWGDGNHSTALAAGSFGSGQGSMTLPFSGSHTYTTQGSFPVVATIYHQSLSGNDNISTEGSTFTVCITPAPTTGTLHVKKLVINDNGGSSATSSFSFAVNGAATTTFEADGQNDLVLPAPATYSVTEASASGYTATYLDCTGINLVAGGEVTCTITNNDIAQVPGNTPPTATPHSITADHDTATSSQVTGSDNETASNLLTFGTTSNPFFGTLVFASNGAFTYTPNLNYTGADSFIFEANDGTASSSPATVSITVAATTSTPVVTTQCNDGIDNDGDGNIDLGDAGCDDAADNDETNSSGGSSHHHGGSSSSNTGGEVLGAQTSPECSEYLLAYIKAGADNDSVEVAKLQAFLNNFEANTLDINGSYDQATESAVRAFQLKYAADVLAPWGLNGSTGYVYYTTRKEVNTIFCKFEKEFPLSQEQLDEIAYVRAIQPTLHAQASSGAAGMTLGAQTQTSLGGNAAQGTVLATTTAKTTTKATTKATTSTSTSATGGSWWTNFINWLFGK